MKKKILTVDDDPNITDVIKLTLESTGRYDVSVVNDSKEAIDTIRQLMPDLIILDVLMPPPIGVAIVEEVKRDDALKHLKYVFITSLVSRVDPDKPGEIIGGQAFLSKPINVNQLINFVDAQLAVDQPSVQSPDL
jgi:CheY-like chemotaxis protein